MKKLVIALAAGAIAAAAYSIGNVLQHQHGASGGMHGCCGGSTSAQKPDDSATAKLDKGVQKATIVVTGGKYSPATINVLKDKLVQLAFKLGDQPGCGDVLVIESLKVKKELRADKPNLVEFTPKKAGTIPFTCGMGMLRGKIVVK